MKSTTRDALLKAALRWKRSADVTCKRAGLFVENYLCRWDLPLYRAVKRYERATKPAKRRSKP